MRMQVQVRMDKTHVLLLRDWALDKRKEDYSFRLNSWLNDTIIDGMIKEGIL